MNKKKDIKIKDALISNIQLADVLDLGEIQQLQDLFADATGVASIITYPDGVPITKPSNFCRLCNDIVRRTEKGRANCFKSDAFIGSPNPSMPVVQHCLSNGLWHAGTPILVGGQHIANWLIGQVRDEEYDETKMLLYADVIGTDRKQYLAALKEVPVMSVGQLKKLSRLLSVFAKELSEKAYTNLLLKKQITDSKQAEEAIKIILHTTIDGFYLVDMEGRIIETNDSYCDMIGYSGEELLKMKVKDIEAIDTEEVIKSRLQRIFETGSDRFETKHIRKDGRIIDIEVSVDFLAKEQQKLYCFMRDITGRKQAEEALKESKTTLEKAQQIARIGSWEYDIATDKPIWSRQMFELFGRDPSLGEPSWKEHQRYIHPDDWETLDAAVASGAPYNIEFRLLHPTEGAKWCWTIGQPIHDSAGKIVKLSGTAQDIHAHKQAKEELLKAKERAEESDRLKSAFLANMSHEIRTPMNGILGFADLLKEPMLTGEEQQEYIQIIEKSGNRMLNIINDIINISKIESGQMELSFSDTIINDQLEFIYSFFRHEADQKGIQLSFNNLLPPGVTIIRTDREKLYAILTNLVKNAIKYTDCGAIEIGCNLKTNIDPTELVSEPVELLYCVKDTGIGISPDKQVAIFDRFIQVDTYDSKAKQGAGLGLAITKAYVEMLGGQIWVESEIDKGSNFQFSIPFKQAFK